MNTARAGALKRQGETRAGKDAGVLAPSRRQDGESQSILFAVAGTGGMPGSAGSRIWQDRHPESEAQAEPPYWATWSLV
jgi:hypothetical protein